MGIDVNNAKVVTLNSAHEKRVVTDPQQNISTVRYGTLDIVSLFRRRTVKNDNYDGNPLIYALKRKLGYTIAFSDTRQLIKNGKVLLPRALKLSKAYDIVVPLPSSSNLSRILAKRAAGSRPIFQCFDKATLAQTLTAAPSPNAVIKRDRQNFTSQLARMQKQPGNEIIEMKSIKLNVRKYFNPLAANNFVNRCKGHHVLLVDDIVGSGTSLISAQNMLIDAGASSVHALTFFSQLR